MKKIKLTIVLVFSFVINSVAQSSNSEIIVIPGVGTNLIKLGMSEAAATNALHKKGKLRTYQEEMESFKIQENFSIDSLPVFLLGFDKVVVFDTLPTALPVYNLYFLKDSLIYFTITSYGTKDSTLLKKIKLQNGVRMFDKEKKVIQQNNKNCVKISYGDYGDYVFFSDGLELTFDNETKKLTVISVFKKMPNFDKLIKTNSERLKLEFGSLQ